MTVIDETRGERSNWLFGVGTDCAKPRNIWVELAWTVLEAADAFGDDVAIEACQSVIDDYSNGDLPAQSDMNIILGFLDIHAH